MDLKVIYSKLSRDMDLIITRKEQQQRTSVFSCCPIPEVSDMEYLPRCLYITTDPGLMEACTVSPILMLASSRADIPSPLPGNVSYCITDAPLNSINQYILNLFQTELIMMQAKEDCIHALHSNSGLYSILRIGSEQMDNPVFLVDFSYKILEHYPRNAIPEVLNRINGSDYLVFDPEIARKENLFSRVIAADEPFIIRSDQFSYRMLMCTIRSGKSPLAYICIPETGRTLTQEDKEFSAILAEVLAIELLKSHSYTSDVRTQDRFLTDLLDGNITSSAVLGERLRLLGLEYKSYKRVMVIPISGQNESLIPSVINYLNHAFTGQSIFMYKGSIICFISKEDLSILPARQMTDLRNYLSQHTLTASVSSAFTDLIDAPAYYRQAILLMPAPGSDESDSILIAEDLILEQMVMRIDNLAELRSLIHPDIRVLRENDNRYNTEYNLTLYTYLSSGRKAQRAADILGIRKSSFFYRIDKIRELIDFSLEDHRKLFCYDLSFQIIRHLASNNQLQPEDQDFGKEILTVDSIARNQFTAD